MKELKLITSESVISSTPMSDPAPFQEAKLAWQFMASSQCIPAQKALPRASCFSRLTGKTVMYHLTASADWQSYFKVAERTSEKAYEKALKHRKERRHFQALRNTPWEYLSQREAGEEALTDKNTCKKLPLILPALACPRSKKLVDLSPPHSGSGTSPSQALPLPLKLLTGQGKRNSNTCRALATFFCSHNSAQHHNSWDIFPTIIHPSPEMLTLP